MINTSLTQNNVQDDLNNEDDEIFHNNTLAVNNAFPIITTVLCGKIYRNYHEVNDNSILLFFLFRHKTNTSALFLF